MSEQVLDKFIEAMMSVLNSAKDFTLEQAPDVLQQVIAWEIASGILSAVAGLLLLTLSFFLGRQFNKYDRNDWENEGYMVASGVGCIVAFVFGVILTPMGTVTAVKATVAPKVVLIEKLTGMVRGSK